MTLLVREYLTFWVEFQQSDIYCLRAMTLSPLHLLINWPVFIIIYLQLFECLTTAVKRYRNFKNCPVDTLSFDTVQNLGDSLDVCRDIMFFGDRL